MGFSSCQTSSLLATYFVKLTRWHSTKLEALLNYATEAVFIVLSVPEPGFTVLYLSSFVAGDDGGRANNRECCCLCWRKGMMCTRQCCRISELTATSKATCANSSVDVASVLHLLSPLKLRGIRLPKASPLPACEISLSCFLRHLKSLGASNSAITKSCTHLHTKKQNKNEQNELPVRSDECRRMQPL